MAFCQHALDLGATRAAYIDADRLVLSDELRRLCERNACGRFNTNWSCPPHAGTMEECRAQVAGFRRGLVIQTVIELEDSFDLEGMDAGMVKHNGILRGMYHRMREQTGQSVLGLGVGRCDYCETCTFPGQPCPFPEERFCAVEGYGIHAAKLAKDCGMPYTNGANTVSYLGILLFDPLPKA